jgi:F0F1-type ATP synthase membrane subunit b/b'
VKTSSPSTPQDACELKRKVRDTILLAWLALAVALAQPAEPAVASMVAEQAADSQGHTAQKTHAETDTQHGLSDLIWPIVNFAVLCGALYYFFRDPLSRHLRERHATIRKDLVDAGELNAAAAAQLAEIEHRLQALPGEIDALRRRGAEEIAAEERRIAEQAARERDRLVEQTRREIDLQVRLAKRELVEHAATLAVQIARERIEREITPADHQRLTERYLHQLEKGSRH